MTLVIVNGGRAIAMKALINHTAGQNLILRLFKSNTTPADTDVTATYTQADFTGYAAKTLVGSLWTVTSANPSVASYPLQTFASSAAQAAQTIYGYYLTQESSGLLVWAERFTTAVSVSLSTSTVPVYPRITGT